METLKTTLSTEKLNLPPKNSNRDLLAPIDTFLRRHLGSNSKEVEEMLDLLGYSSLEALIDAAVPQQIRLKKSLNLPVARTEHEVLVELKLIASKNRIYRSL